MFRLIERATLASLALSVALAISDVPLVAYADRFGAPLMDKVIADLTTLYTTADRAQPIGPLARDAIVVVLDQQGDMVQVPGGWVAASDVTETVDSWVAEVSDPSASVYAYPDVHSDVRRTVQAGDLVRVTGVSHGVGSDQSVWWATTEGYVGLTAIRAATGDEARRWTLPGPELAPLGWWAQAMPANVRASRAPTLRSWPATPAGSALMADASPVATFIRPSCSGCPTLSRRLSRRQRTLSSATSRGSSSTARRTR